MGRTGAGGDGLVRLSPSSGILLHQLPETSGWQVSQGETEAWHAKVSEALSSSNLCPRLLVLALRTRIKVVGQESVQVQRVLGKS